MWTLRQSREQVLSWAGSAVALEKVFKNESAPEIAGTANGVCVLLWGSGE